MAFTRSRAQAPGPCRVLGGPGDLVSRVISRVTPFRVTPCRVLITLLITHLLSPLGLAGLRVPGAGPEG